jgi:hypothetical protein
VFEPDDSTERSQTMTKTDFIFRVLFQRSFIDDADAVGGMEKLTGENGDLSHALIDQLASEINLNPAFRNRFVFSPYIIFAGNEYYILGQITVNSTEKNSLEAWDNFLKEFQDTYDTYGMVGHFRIEPTANQSHLRDWARKDAWPVPPWSDTPYVPPKVSEEITLVRIALDGARGVARNSAKVVYWGWRPSTEDYDDQPLDPIEALRLITSGKAIVEVACTDPDDKHNHHYEGRIERLQRI